VSVGAGAAAAARASVRCSTRRLSVRYEQLPAASTAAQAAYDELIDPATPAGRHQELTRALLAYCRLDTWAMLMLTRRLADADGPAA
jgi:hypothetical protein